MLGHAMLVQGFNSSRAETEFSASLQDPVAGHVSGALWNFSFHMPPTQLPPAIPSFALNLLLLLEKQEGPRGDVSCLPSKLLVYL